MTSSSPLLVTGVAGFIGFHVAKKELEQGRAVIGIDNLNAYYDVSLKMDRLKILQENPSFTFYQTDISDRAAMKAIWDGHPDCLEVIHLAAQPGVRYSLVDPYCYIQSNVMGHLVLMELARHREGFKHFVYASSSSVYGSNTKLPFSLEDSCDHSISLYAATKRSDELMSHTYAHLFKIPMTGLRLFTVYGPWGRPDMATYEFTRAIDQGEPIKVYNHGEMKRDFTYIDDVVEGIISALNHPPKDPVPHRLFNLGCHRSENLLDFIAGIEKALGKKAKMEFHPLQKGDVVETYADIKESEDILGFKPKTPVSVGIPLFVRWYRDYYASEKSVLR